MTDYIINIGGEVLKGTTKEVAVMLRQEPFELTMTRIADILSQTRANISLVLHDTPYSGRMIQKRPTIVPKDFQIMTDEVIATKYGVSVLSVFNQRKRLNIKLPRKINLDYRQRLLVGVLFGKNYGPGEHLEEVIKFLVKKIFTLQNQRNMILDFYFGGSVSSATHKVYRHQLRQRMKKHVQANVTKRDIKKFISQGVLVKV